MHKTLKNYWIIAFTLLALVGQGLMANGSSMVPMTHADLVMTLQNDDNHQMMTMASVTPLAKQSVFISQSMTDCHGGQRANIDPQTANSNNCCNGLGGCSIDCNHCLTISFTAGLIDMQLDIANAPANPAPIAVALNSFSVDFPPAFRPPIV
ncbi:hypothetical protein [Shewanella sp. OMA3-2]|uniref:hypothetical protein n=1 Tax=Shewanella sp. OMA3-2 TaxID=2908650 RepID=UPI001F171640|nr:hypothetical protein [Shewanella sp. OMA3-2]UJF22390.1 hypothetical protein L0B17_02910 [Shewanella sp. OMA3-2]